MKFSSVIEEVRGREKDQRTEKLEEKFFYISRSFKISVSQASRVFKSKAE